MAISEAPPPTATDEGCPVCLAPVTDEPECPHCYWTLDGNLVLGRLTPGIRHAFDERLAAARRHLDLRAAARAAGYPRHGVPERLARLESLIRGGPPRPGERDDVLRELERESTPTPGRSGQVLDGVTAEITVRGLRAAVFHHGVEDAEATEWPWTDLLPELPQDEDELLFRLAGGIGDLAIAPGTPEPKDLGVAAMATVLVSRLPGWAVPERLLARLRRRLPHTRTLYLPAPEPLPAPLRHAAGFTAVVCGTGPASDDVRLVGGCPDGSVTVWRLWRSEPIATRRLHNGLVSCVDLAEDGLSLVTGGKDGAVRLWAFGASGRVRVLTWHDGWVNALRLRSGVVFSIGDDAQVYRSVLGCAVVGGAPLTRVGWDEATALEATADGATVIVGGSDGANLRDGRTGERRDRIGTSHPVTSLALSSNDRLLALGCADGVVRVHDTRGGRALVSEHGGHTGAVRHVTFGPDGSLATADSGGTVRVWSANGRDTTAVGAHPDMVRGLAFTASGHLLSAGGEGLVRTWPIPRTD
jgi:hypothetical protein